MKISTADMIRTIASILKIAGLKEHAKYELEKSGLLSKDSVYNGLLGNSVLKLCECFAKQGHSGHSADVALDLFETLAKFHTLTPITGDEKEWEDVSKMSGEPLWQNKRDPSFFSKDSGKSWYVVGAKKKKGFVTNIEKDTVDNDNFRKVLYTGKNSQLVLMALKPEEEIGEEVHKDTDQFFRIDSGSGKVVINGKSTDIKDGFAFVIPQGAKHNVINTGKEPLKLYSVYSPPHHEDGTIHKTKEEAESDNEHFDGKTTE
jgi:mannose-6-phosphate isomerase-like protein (cupin superfamily)